MEVSQCTHKEVVVDRHLQTSVYDVFAAGDVAEFGGRFCGIIPAAVEQAKIAAINMLNKKKHVYEGTILSNTLKIAGIDLTLMGLVDPVVSRYEEVKKSTKIRASTRRSFWIKEKSEP